MAASQYAFDAAAGPRLVSELTPTIPTADEDTLRRYCEELCACVMAQAERHWCNSALADRIANDAADGTGLYGDARERFLAQVHQSAWDYSRHGEELLKELHAAGWFGLAFMDQWAAGWPLVEP